MHIPDGFLDNRLNAAAFALSSVAVGFAVVRASRAIEERQVPLLGVTAAFVFAAQMINFPVVGGTSGHFLGATFAAIMLGPANGVLIMTIVIAIQCLLFADGGLTSLGTNVLNMALIAGVGGFAVFTILRATLRGRKGFLAAAALASWLSIVMAAAACAVELAVSGTSPLVVVLPVMTGVHAVIGVGEAIITTAVISIVLASRPDLVGAWRPGTLTPDPSPGGRGDGVGP